MRLPARLTALRRLVGSTPVRQALGLIAVFATVNLVTLGLAYLALRNQTEDAMRANLAQHMAGFDVTASPRALEVLVAAEADAANPADRVFAFIAPDGRVTGNAHAAITATGVQISPLPDGRPLSADGYLPRIDRVAGGVLIVAESRRPLRALGEVFAGLLVLSLVPTVLISLGIGGYISFRTRRRVARIETALDRLSEGALETRVPAEPSRQDDLARIGGRINHMAGALQSSTEALKQVSTDIAHDLKTPLQRLSVALHDLRDGLAEGDANTALADRALAEAARADGIFRGLLTIAQIESGAVKAGFAPIDLARLAREIGELFQPAAEESAHHLTIEAPETPIMVTGNRDLLGQAMANLVENALRHTPGGCGVTVRAAQGGGRAVLEVADTGPGIPEAERDAVLRRFYRLDRSRGTEGNGLGLALVAAAAAAHGATLTLDDNRPGLIVRLTFPR